MKRVLYITDSLGAPRRKPEECFFDDTWCYKVSKSLINVEPIYYNINGLDTNRIVTDIPIKLSLYRPDIIILQVGIVDCAPRALKLTEKKIISRLGFFGKFIHYFIRKNYSNITKIRDISYVSLGKFEKNLKYVKNSFETIPVYVIAIGKPCEKYIHKSPLISNRHTHYNNAMKRIFKDNFIDPYHSLDDNQLEQIYMSDFHHLNKKGQNLLAEYVIKKLSEYLA